MVSRKTAAAREQMPTTVIAKPEDVRVLAALRLVESSDVIRVLDFGGAAGTHYLFARHVLPRNVRLNWCVVETPSMVRVASPLMANEELTFASSIAEAVQRIGLPDLVFSSGAVQYVPDTVATVNELLAIGAKAIFLTRWGLTDGAQFSIVQTSALSSNGPGPLPAGFSDRLVRYPVTFVNRQTIETAIRARYSLPLVLAEAPKAYPTRAGWVPMFGFFGVS